MGVIVGLGAAAAPDGERGDVDRCQHQVPPAVGHDVSMLAISQGCHRAVRGRAFKDAAAMDSPSHNASCWITNKSHILQVEKFCGASFGGY